MDETRDQQICRNLACNLQQICATPPSQRPLLRISDTHSLNSYSELTRFSITLTLMLSNSFELISGVSRPGLSPVLVQLVSCGSIAHTLVVVLPPHLPVGKKFVQFLSCMTPSKLTKLTKIQQDTKEYLNQRGT